MTLDEDEIGLVLLGLYHLRTDATDQAEGTADKARVCGAAWMCCKHVAYRCGLLIDRIEQWQRDQKHPASPRLRRAGEEADDA